MPILKTDNAAINYDVIGDEGSPLVTLVNGHTRSSSDFRMMARILAEAGFRTLLIDNRAAGKSEAFHPFTIEDMCRDVVSVWDEINADASHLLGISMGGFISLGIAINYPERVRKLVLVSTAPEERYINPTGGGWINEGTKLEEKMRSYFAPGFVERNPVLFNTMVSQIRQAIESGTFTKKSDMQRAALKGSEWTTKLPTIKSPTMIIHGDQDRVIDVEAAHLLKEKIPGARFTALPGIGHLLLAEAPKDLYRIAVEFLKE